MSNDKMREALASLKFLWSMATEALDDNTAVDSAYEEIKAALTQQPEPAGLDKLDPRVGDGEKIAHDLYDAYRKAFDKFAGPPEFRHACNYDDYHKAGLLGVYVHCKSGSPQPAQVPEGWRVEAVGEAMHIVDPDGKWCGFMPENGPAQAMTHRFLAELVSKAPRACVKVPKGWKPVPTNPTLDMVRAGHRTLAENGGVLKAIWAAMLTAAPSIAEKPDEN